MNNINNKFRVIRIVSAKNLLLKNSKKTKTYAAQIFNLSMKIIKSSVKRQYYILF